MLSLLRSRSGPTALPLTGQSYWQRLGGANFDTPGATTSCQLPTHVDFAVIGGGFAGLSTALALAEVERDARILLLESQFLGFGASGRNTGLLGPLPAPLWLASADQNAEHLWGIQHLNRRVHALSRWLTEDVGDRRVAATRLRIASQGRLTATGLERVRRTMTRAGIEHDASRGHNGHLVVGVDGYTIDPYHTICRLADLARQRGIMLAEHTPVRGLGETPAGVEITMLDGRQLVAGRAIVCTNAYTSSLSLPQAPKGKPVFNFLLVTDPIMPIGSGTGPDEQQFVVELNRDYVFFRMHEGRIVYGGIERFRPYGRDDFAVPPDVLARLAKCLHRSFPDLRLPVSEVWRGAYHQTSTDLPQIRRTGARGRIVLNVGYGGTGVAMTMICGRLAAAQARDGRFVDRDDERLFDAMVATRNPLAALARFSAGVAADLIRYSGPANA